MLRVVFLLLIAWLLVACSVDTSPQQFTRPAFPTPTPLPRLKTPRTPASDGTLPQLVARISFSLAPGQRLSELMIDHDTNRLYVVGEDSSAGGDGPDVLYVLDATTDKRVATITLAASGSMTYDPVHHRLYVAPSWHNGKEVTVVDTEALKVIDTLSPPGLGVAVDPKRNRVYIGGRVYDSTTLQIVGDLPKPGIPYYNPLRDEVYLSYGTVYRVNPTTLQITGDLMPEITPQLPGPVLDSSMCCGYEVVNALYVMPERNIIAVMHGERRAGGGLTYDSWTFFNATTLERVEPPPLLSNYAYLTEPVDGLIYRGTDDGLRVYDVQGILQDQRNGLLGDPIVNPRTKQLYISPHTDRKVTLILDLGTLTPLGALPVHSIDTVDAQSGRIYAFDRNELVVFAERGQPAVWPNNNVQRPPLGALDRIQFSPGYVADHTLFASTADMKDLFKHKLYRSTDGGQTWTRLNIGWIKDDSDQNLDMVLSPQFATDHTLFAWGAGSWATSSWGDGVYRSTDGGDTWQPLWNGLWDLRVRDVALSPLYAQDGTLLAYTDGAIYRSTDRGLSWSMVATGLKGLGLPPPQSLLPADPTPPTSTPNMLADAVLSSNFQTDHTAYKIEKCGLLRTIDSGTTWQHALDKRVSGCERTEGGSERGRTTALAVSPLLNDGHYQLFVGRLSGKVLVVDPASLTWEPGNASAAPELNPALAQCSPASDDAFIAAYTAALGCPVQMSEVSQSSYQPFEHGLMFFGPGEPSTEILYADGHWEAHTTKQSDSQPPELHLERRLPAEGNFARTWWALGGPQATMGWATEPTHYYFMKRQEFEHGTLFTGIEGEVYLLYADGHWEKEAGW